MTRIAVPAFLAAVGLSLYLVGVGAPPRVDALVIPCFLLAVLVPGLLAPSLRSLRNRLPIIGALILTAQILWDGTSYLVIMKNEPFGLLRYNPWMYPFGWAFLGAIVVVNALAIQLIHSRLHRCGREPEAA